MNELKNNGTQIFMGIEIPIIEGGFGENQKVILAKTISQIHGQPLKKINQLINENIDELLYSRYISKKMRNSGARLKGPKKRDKYQNTVFEQNLEKLILEKITK